MSCTVNYFELQVPDCLVYQYDLKIQKIDAKNPSKVTDSIHGPTNRRVFEALREKHIASLPKSDREAMQIAVYDGQAGMYSPKLFDVSSAFAIEILDDGK